MLQGEQARKEKSLGGRAVLQALRSNLSLLGELAARYEAAFQPERPEGKASPWRAGRTHGERGARTESKHGSFYHGQGQVGVRLAPEQREELQQQTKHPAARTANIRNIQVSQSRSVQQLQLPTSATSGL